MCHIQLNHANKYYRMQILKEDSTGLYYVWLKWGRVGESSVGRDLQGPSRYENTAIRIFFKKYKVKTGNAFDTEEFIPKHGKYIPVDNQS